VIEEVEVAYDTKSFGKLVWERECFRCRFETNILHDINSNLVVQNQFG
jgi:hypothetical protein